MVLYSDEYDGYIPAATATWFLVYMPYMPEGGTDKNFRTVKIYRCAGYPNTDWKKRQIITRHQRTEVHRPDGQGRFEQVGPSKLTAFEMPSDTIHLVDNENGSWRPIITGYQDAITDLNDVWSPAHLPYSEAPPSGVSTRNAASPPAPQRKGECGVPRQARQLPEITGHRHRSLARVRSPASTPRSS
jgi:hypothetical protein